jgi:NitT/TauT family transport system substrate-binding protein
MSRLTFDLYAALAHIGAALIPKALVQSPKLRLGAFSLFAASCFAFLGSQTARAEVTELRVARQYGISHLQMALLDELKLIEKHAAQEGLPGLTVNWRRFSDGPGMNEALLSGNIDIANGGLTALLILYDKSKGAYTGLSPLSSMPAVLMTRSPDIHSVRDLKDSDRIAVVARVSMQAVILRMLAVQAFGKDQAEKLDFMTVPLPHPDAMASLLSHGTEITAHFTAAPYYQQEEAAGLHRALSSTGVLGGPATYSVTWASKKFMMENPKVTHVVLSALAEATQLIKDDPHKAARTYIKAEGSTLDPAFIEKIIRDPENNFTMVPQRVMRFADFMADTGMLKKRVEKWQDLFPLQAGQNGN